MLLVVSPNINYDITQSQDRQSVVRAAVYGIVCQFESWLYNAIGNMCLVGVGVGVTAHD